MDGDIVVGVGGGNSKMASQMIGTFWDSATPHRVAKTKKNKKKQTKKRRPLPSFSGRTLRPRCRGRKPSSANRWTRTARPKNLKKKTRFGPERSRNFSFDSLRLDFFLGGRELREAPPMELDSSIKKKNNKQNKQNKTKKRRGEEAIFLIFLQR